MQLEQARFERRRLELEMQMKELKSKHHLLEEERELERKVKRTALENDDIRSHSTSARDKSPFNWTQKRETSQCGPEESTTFYHQIDQQLASKQHLK